MIFASVNHHQQLFGCFLPVADANLEIVNGLMTAATARQNSNHSHFVGLEKVDHPPWRTFLFGFGAELVLVDCCHVVIVRISWLATADCWRLVRRLSVSHVHRCLRLREDLVKQDSANCNQDGNYRNKEVRRTSGRCDYKFEPRIQIVRSHRRIDTTRSSLGECSSRPRGWQWRKVVLMGERMTWSLKEQTETNWLDNDWNIRICEFGNFANLQTFAIAIKVLNVSGMPGTQSGRAISIESEWVSSPDIIMLHNKRNCICLHWEGSVS